MKSKLLPVFAIILSVPFSFPSNSLFGKEEKPPFEEVFKKMDAEVRATLKKNRAEGLKELERVGNLLSKDYPD